MKKAFIIDFIIEILAIFFMIISFIFAVIYSEYIVFAFIGLFLMMNTVALYIIFFNYIKNCDLFISDYSFFDISKKEEVVINCRKSQASYFMDYEGKEIEFRTNERLFGDQMFFAYLVRNVRYFEVSRKRPLIFLFKRKVKLKNIKLKKLTVILGGKKYVLVSNGVSKCKFTLINKAWYWKYFFTRKAIADAMVKTVHFIDEKKFQSGKIWV